MSSQTIVIARKLSNWDTKAAVRVKPRRILLREEERNIQKDVADYTVYPVVSIGVTYRF